MTRLKLAVFPAIFAVALVGAGCDINVGEHGFSMDLGSAKAQDEWTRTYTVAAGGRLEIVNINGAITATPASGDAIEVRAERIAKAGTDERARELLRQIELAETVTDTRVRIETKTPQGRINHQVRYFVRVPNGIAVSFENTNGAVRLENLDGEITASTTNGGVRGVGLKGHVKASTTNGGLNIAMADVTGDVELETTNGGIRLELPRDAKANVEARCTNGGISVDSSLGVDASEQSRRRFRGTLNGGGPTISAETTNGGVRISGLGRAQTN